MIVYDENRTFHFDSSIAAHRSSYNHRGLGILHSTKANVVTNSGSGLRIAHEREIGLKTFVMAVSATSAGSPSYLPVRHDGFHGWSKHPTILIGLPPIVWSTLPEAYVVAWRVTIPNRIPDYLQGLHMFDQRCFNRPPDANQSMLERFANHSRDSIARREWYGLIAAEAQTDQMAYALLRDGGLAPFLDYLLESGEDIAQDVLDYLHGQLSLYPYMTVANALYDSRPFLLWLYRRSVRRSSRALSQMPVGLLADAEHSPIMR